VTLINHFRNRSSGNHIDSAQEVFRGFIIACGNGPALLEFCEEILDQMTGLIENFVIMTRHETVLIR
jgi:hypothetical protein